MALPVGQEALADDQLEAAQVLSGSCENVYMINVVIQDKVTGVVFADSGRLVDLMHAGKTRRFRLKRQDPSSPALRSYVCVAQFSDSDGYRWRQYMMGLLEPAGRHAQAMSVRVTLLGDRLENAWVSAAAHSTCTRSQRGSRTRSHAASLRTAVSQSQCSAQVRLAI
jgi:hypothetical protein